jgi:redox-sensitive bicupin YhaK (pirin superfamily)
MLTIRKAQDRGYSELGWLQSWHSFSFSDYYDIRHMNFGNLRVINDDIIAGGGGFGTHPHRDMEIVTYILDGELEHRDSMGNGSIIRAGDVQRMTAGSGIQHSEFNHSASDEVRLLQIWFIPDRQGHRPGYQQKHFDNDCKQGQLRLVASRDGRNGAVSLNQDVDMYATRLDGGESIGHEIKPGRHAWLQVARGRLSVNGEAVSEGDGISVDNAQMLYFDQGSDAEMIIFDMLNPN